MAAYRIGVKTVIIPADNEADLENIDQTVRKHLNFVVAENVDDIIETVLVKKNSENSIQPNCAMQGKERHAVRQ